MAEAPIIMMMTAANALVRDRRTFLALRRFLFILNGGLTVVMALAVLPWIFRFLTDRVIGLPPDIARLTHARRPPFSCCGRRRSATAASTRESWCGTTCRGAWRTAPSSGSSRCRCAPPGARAVHAPARRLRRALALASGVLAEAAASRWMAAAIVRRILDGAAGGAASAR